MTMDIPRGCCYGSIIQSERGEPRGQGTGNTAHRLNAEAAGGRTDQGGLHGGKGTASCSEKERRNGGFNMKKELLKLIEKLEEEDLRLLYIVALELIGKSE